MLKQTNTIYFRHLFQFAEKEFGISWNDANDLFFDTVLPYKSYQEFILADMGDVVECGDNELNIPWDDNKTPEENWEVRAQMLKEVSKEDILSVSDQDLKATLVIQRFMESLDVEKLLILCN